MNFRQEVDLEVESERIGQAHVTRKGAQNQVAHLNAARGNDIAETIVIIAKELGKVMQQDQQYT